MSNFCYKLLIVINYKYSLDHCTTEMKICWSNFSHWRSRLFLEWFRSARFCILCFCPSYCYTQL